MTSAEPPKMHKVKFSTSGISKLLYQIPGSNKQFAVLPRLSPTAVDLLMMQLRGLSAMLNQQAADSDSAFQSAIRIAR